MQRLTYHSAVHWCMMDSWNVIKIVILWAVSEGPALREIEGIYLFYVGGLLKARHMEDTKGATTGGQALMTLAKGVAKSNPRKYLKEP